MAVGLERAPAQLVGVWPATLRDWTQRVTRRVYRKSPSGLKTPRPTQDGRAKQGQVSTARRLMARHGARGLTFEGLGQASGIHAERRHTRLPCWDDPRAPSYHPRPRTPEGLPFS